MQKLILLVLVSITSMLVIAKPNGPSPSKKRVNVFIVSRVKTGKIDITASYVKIRAAINAFHAPDKFLLIYARSAGEAARKIECKMRRNHAMIASLWFDSHGHYTDRQSSFSIGNNKYYFKNISDTIYTRDLSRISNFCDKQTKIALGACYAGATYAFPATDSTKATRMNGDSLLVGLGTIFHDAVIYGSESWVMAKPGMFTTKYGLAGNLIQKRYKDIIYEPVWNNLGAWNSYTSSNQVIKPVPTLTINRWGDIKEGGENYGNSNKGQKKIAQKKAQLEPGLAIFK